MGWASRGLGQDWVIKFEPVGSRLLFICKSFVRKFENCGCVTWSHLSLKKGEDYNKTLGFDLGHKLNSKLFKHHNSNHSFSSCLFKLTILSDSQKKTIEK